MKSGWISVKPWFVMLLVFVSLLQIAAAESQVRLLDSEALAAAKAHGIQQVEPGKYTIWVWSEDARKVILALDEQSLTVSPSEKAQAGRYTWKSAGAFESDKKKDVSLQLYSEEKGREQQPRTVGWVALSPDPEWKPETLFTFTKVFSQTADAARDKRLGVLRSVEKYYAFAGFDSLQEWEARKQELKTHILVSMGAYPFPEKTPLNAHIFGRIEREDYTVEKVYFESYPGFYVTGNLYRPKGKQGPFPGIVSPHGHWKEGRLANEVLGSVPGRAISFAQQGYITLSYDMVGYVDSKQLEHRKFGGPREWLWGISMHGLQFWNSIRAVDFLCSLKDVDPERIACTGASGGGTQTYCLAAVDERVKVAAPVNMISAHYQGGCVCENAPNLRIDAYNIEYGAMMAPRPLLMVCCTGDWTAETPRIEFPAIRSIYDLFGVPDRVYSVQIDAEHNYNKQSREAVYAWFGKWLLGENNPERLREKDFTVEKDKNVRVFPGKMPNNALTPEGLVSSLIERSEKQLREMLPEQKNSLQVFQERMKPAWQHVLGAKQPMRKELVVDRIGLVNQPNLFIEKVVIGRKGVGDQIPGILLIPAHRNPKAMGTLLLDARGKCAFTDIQTGKPNELLQGLLKEGHVVFLPDVFMTGEYDSPFEKAKRDTKTDEFLAYNQTEIALRAQDILTSLAYLQSRFEVEQTNLVGTGDAGLWCLLAAPLAQSLHRVVVDAAAFPSKEDEAFLQRLFVPALRRVGDIRTAQALLTPTPVLIHNTQRVFDIEWAGKTYATAGAVNNLSVSEEPAGAERIVTFLGQ